MKEQFCTYEISLKLKELGFDEPCLGYYEVSNYLEFGFRLRFIEHEDSNPSKQPSNKDCLAPLWQQAITWLFKKLDFYYPYLKIEVFSDGSGTWYQPKDEGNNELEIDFDNLEQAILKALELIKNSEI